MPFNEDFAIWLWENKHLVTNEFSLSNGSRCRLIFRGTRNPDSGPDFVNATLEIDGVIRSGAIEVHMDAADWYQHNHQTDPAYNQVILHVALENSRPQQRTARENGLEAPTLLLSGCLNQPVEKLYLDFRRQSLAANAGEPDCPLAAQEPPQILSRLEDAGAARLTLKGLAFRELRLYHSWDQILYTGMMEALGYSKNQIPFRQLAQHLPVEFIFRELRASSRTLPEKIQGLLFGAAGLLPAQKLTTTKKLNPEIKTFTDELAAFWEDFHHRIGLRPMNPEEWRFFRLRPSNFPTRRLAGMSALLVQFCNEGILNHFLRIFSSLSPKLDEINRELERSLIVTAFGFWLSHYHFESVRAPEGISRETKLIGSDRAREMIVNILFPVFLLCAHETGDGQLESTVKACYRRFPPLTDNVITRQMSVRLFPQIRNRKTLVNTAQKQQGLIYLYKTFCQQTGCGKCQEF
jgi:hypothetical protein